MAGARTKNRIQSDILEWHVPEEVLAVLLKDRSTGDFMFPICHTVCGKLMWPHYRTLITVENEEISRNCFDETIKSKWSLDLNCNVNAPPSRRPWCFAPCRRQNRKEVRTPQNYERE